MAYTCTISKKGVLYVYRVKENGSKERVQNIYAKHCPKKQIKECKQLCSGKKAHHKVKPPCRRHAAIFNNKKEIKKYCQSKTKGTYNVSQRQRIANEANALLKQEMAENQKELIEPVLYTEMPPTTVKAPTKSILRKTPVKSTKSIQFVETPIVTTFQPEVDYVDLKKPKSRRSKFDLPKHYSLNQLKKMAREQQIPGRSKLTTREALCAALHVQC